MGQLEIARGMDAVTALGVQHEAYDDLISWRCHRRLEKHFQDFEPYRGSYESERAFFDQFEPYEVSEAEGNLLVNAGIQTMNFLIIGSTPQTGANLPFSNANASIGVGISATAAAATQTDLQAATGATNRQSAVMNSTFPTTPPVSQQMVYQATFGAGVANFAWNEWGVFNAAFGTAANTGTMLNRKQEALGTKAGGSWTLTVTITIS